MSFEVSAETVVFVTSSILIHILSFQALQYLILISEVDDTEIFKICLEYWNALASDLYRESPFLPPTGSSPLYLPRPTSRRQFYQPILTKV